MSTAKFINEMIWICFSASTFQFKVYQCYPIFHWLWNFLGNMFINFMFWKIHIAWSTGDGKSYSYQKQSNAAFQVATNDKNCSSDIDSFASSRSKFFARVISRFKSFSLNEYDLWILSSVFLMEMFDLQAVPSPRGGSMGA